MNDIGLENTVFRIKRKMSVLAPHRNSVLFSDFLVKGYTCVTLSSVPQERFRDLLRAKVCLGSLITLYDDFADRPSQINPLLLGRLYDLKLTEHNSISNSNSCEVNVLLFAKSLLSEINVTLMEMPNYVLFHEILCFDLEQFYNANRFSSLLTTYPFINNSLEKRLHSHHNMGMIMVAMMDLMATEWIEMSEIGAMREVFLIGQRMGRIFNVLTTQKREALENDITGELSTYQSDQEVDLAKNKLRKEIEILHERVSTYSSHIKTFSVHGYLTGLRNLYQLHQDMEAMI